MMSGVRERGASFRMDRPGARFRRFGPFGPAYEVLAEQGDTVRVRVVETGEELDYALDRSLQDPEA